MRAERFLELNLERLKTRVKLLEAAGALGWILAAFFATVLAIAAADQVWTLGALARRSAVIALAAACAACAFRWVVVPLFQRVSSVYAATLIEQMHPEFKNSVVTFIQLKADAEQPSDITEAVGAKAAHDLAEADIDAAAPLALLKRPAIALAIVVGIMILFGLLSPKPVLPSLGRAFGLDIASPTQTQILALTPPDGTSVVEGEDIGVSALIGGVQPTDVWLQTSDDGENWQSVKMNRNGDKKWAGGIKNITADLFFRVRAGDAVSDINRLIVRPTPAVLAVTALLAYPPGSKPESVDGGDIAAPAGTDVTLLARTNTRPSRGILRFQDGSQISMQRGKDARSLLAKFRITKSQTYRIEFWDAGIPSLSNRDTTEYRIRVSPDSSPSVRLIEPADGSELPLASPLQVRVQAEDDHGISRAVIKLQKAGRGETPAIEKPLADLIEKGTPAKIEIKQALATRDLGFKAGDDVSVWVEVWDNRPDAPQKAQSEVHRIKIKSPEHSEKSSQEQSQETAAAGKAPQEKTSPTAKTPSAEMAAANQALAELARMAQRERAALRRLQKAMAQAAKGAGQADASGKTEPGDGSAQDSSATDQTQASTSSSGTDSAKGGNAGKTSSPELPDEPPTLEREFLAGPTVDTEDLKTIGRLIKEAAERLKNDGVDEKFLSDAGMSQMQLRHFVAQYQRKLSEAAPLLLKTEIPEEINAALGKLPPDEERIAAEESRTISEIAAPLEAEPDELKGVIEPETRRVSPRYRDIVREYFKALSTLEER